MAVLAQFTPGGPAGQLANESQSWMDRAHSRDIQDQQMQIQKQEEARKQAQFDVLKPVLQAKSEADIAQAQDTLAAAKGVQDLRMQYIPRVQEGRDAFGQLAGIDDPDERAKAANQWIGKYAPLASLSEYKSEFDTYLHHATDFNLIAQKKSMLDSMQASISSRKAMELDSKAAIEAGKQETQKAVAQTRADASTANAQTRAYATTTAARTRSSQGMLDNLGDMLADPNTPPELIKDQRALIEKHSGFSPQRLPAVEELLVQKRKAEAAGDSEAATVFGDAIKKMAPHSGGSDEPPPEPPGFLARTATKLGLSSRATPDETTVKPIPAPKPPVFPPNTKTVSVEGKEHKLGSDEKGNRFYYNDEKHAWIPLPANP